MKKLFLGLLVLSGINAKSEVDSSSGVRLTLLGGPGPVGIQTMTYGDIEIPHLNRGFVLGGSLQIDTTDDSSKHIQIMGLSNGTFLIGIGINL